MWCGYNTKHWKKFRAGMIFITPITPKFGLFADSTWCYNKALDKIIFFSNYSRSDFPEYKF